MTEMTEREQLELAAKAAGVPLYPYINELSGTVFFRTRAHEHAIPVRWDPLESDGDAFRLAVKLQIQITPGTYNKDEFTAYSAGRAEAHEHCHYLQDEYAATRLAVFRVAVEIGRGM